MVENLIIPRFYNDGKQNLELSWEKNDMKNVEKQSPQYKISAPLLRPEGSNSSAGKARPNGGLKFGNSKVFPESHEPKGKQILDPGSDIFLQWNRIFLFSCLVALFVDPLFFYLPSVENPENSSCMMTDLNLGIIVTCFRTVADIFYVFHIFIKFRTAYVSPSSRVFGRGELVMDPSKIARRYLKSDFAIDVIAALPLPQVLEFCF